MNNHEFWDGNIPWLSAKDLKTFYLSDSIKKVSPAGVTNGTRMVDAGTVLILIRGMTLHKDVPVGVATCPVTFNQDLKALEPLDGIDGGFVAAYLTRSKLRLMQFVSHSGHGTGRLPSDILASFPIPAPPLDEQRRIVAVLSTWDRGIGEAERLLVLKEQRKRALMQQLLTGKRRFPEFKGRWRKFSMSDLFEPVYRTATGAVEAVLSISSKKGFERQEKKYSKVIAGKNLENYVILQRGEFAYNKGNSKTYPQGCIFRLDDYAEAAVPNVYFNFRIKDLSQTDSDFFRSYFEAGLLNMGLRGLINTGIRNNGLLNIYEPDFYALTVKCPDVTEQRRIAAVLNTCDDELRHLRAQVAVLKQQKKGLMQKLLTGQVRVPTR